MKKSYKAPLIDLFSSFPVGNVAAESKPRTIMLLSLTLLIQFTLISLCLNAKDIKRIGSVQWQVSQGIKEAQ